MKFKVGQRVRVVACESSEARITIGHEGVILRSGKDGCWEWIVEIPTCPYVCPDEDALPPTHWGFDSEHLAPLVDPSAEKFIASIKALGPLKQDLHEILRGEWLS